MFTGIRHTDAHKHGIKVRLLLRLGSDQPLFTLDQLASATSPLYYRTATNYGQHAQVWVPLMVVHRCAWFAAPQETTNTH